MEELKLLLELGPNLTDAGVEAFGYYAIASLLGKVVFGITLLALAGILYSGIMRSVKMHYELKEKKLAKKNGRASA